MGWLGAALAGALGAYDRRILALTGFLSVVSWWFDAFRRLLGEGLCRAPMDARVYMYMCTL